MKVSRRISMKGVAPIFWKTSALLVHCIADCQMPIAEFSGSDVRSSPFSSQAETMVLGAQASSPA
jgi:hypothetical protein